MRSSKPPRASVTALSFGTNSSTWISLFCRKTLPSVFTEIVSGSLSWSRLLACVCGRSIGTPTVRSGADTMKMINSTSMTSTIGVTLISAITGLRRCRRLPNTPECAPPPLIAIAVPFYPLAALVDLARQDRRELVGEAFEPLRLFVHLGHEFVVKNRRRYGCHKADRSCEQGLGDARRDNRQRRVFRRRDRLEARHDAPHRAEQADERAGRADGGEHEEPPLQPFDLARYRDVHHLLDAHLQAGERARLALEAALPFAHAGDEQRRGRVRRARRQRAIEFLERLAGPERALERLHGAPRARVEDRLVDHDRPHPDRRRQQAEHDRLDDPMGLQEQGQQRKVRGSQRQRRLRDVGRIHEASVLSARRTRNGPTRRHLWMLAKTLECAKTRPPEAYGLQRQTCPNLGARPRPYGP